MQVIKHSQDKSGISFCINKGKLNVWFDLWLDKDKEIQGDWNKYIFYSNDKEDLKIQRFQNKSENFEKCFSLAEQYLIDNNLTF